MSWIATGQSWVDRPVIRVSRGVTLTFHVSGSLGIMNETAKNTRAKIGKTLESCRKQISVNVVLGRAQLLLQLGKPLKLRWVPATLELSLIVSPTGFG
jgi:hypothetical protein